MNRSFPDASPSLGKFVNTSLQNIKKSTINISSTIRWRKSFLLLPSLLIALSFFSGCKDADEIGLDALPNGDQLGTAVSDTATIVTTILREDSLIGDELSSQLIGSINSPTFGLSTANVYSQLVLSGTPAFGTNPIADSIVLILAYNGIYGDSSQQQTATVYQLTEDMHVDSTYYTSKTFAYNSTAIGNETYTPSMKSVVLASDTTDTLSSQLRIKLNNSVANDILAQSGTSVFTSNDTWMAYYKGIYIASTPIVNSGQGAISSFSFFASAVKLYFHNDTVPKSYSFSLSNARLNNFTHDYTGTNIANQLAAGGTTDSLAYVQGNSGVKTKISLPYLKHFKDSGSIVVNKAELKITAQNSVQRFYPVPTNLLLTTVSNTGTNIFPIDYYESTGYYGGSYYSTNRTYTFNIARQVQRIIDGTNNSTNFYLVVAGAGVTSNGVVIGSSSNADYRLKFTLYYTKIN